MANNNKKFSSRATMLLMIGLIGFVAYNVILFAIAGFEDHSGTFWTSYVFMLLAFGATGISGYSAKYQDITLRDWIFGYPVFWHCGLFLILELVASTIFMIFSEDIAWGISFAVQFLLLAVFGVMILSCFISKKTIEEVDTKVRTASAYVKLLQADAEMAAEMASDPAVRNAFRQLAEQARYSDPMSDPMLADLEREISLHLAEAKSYLSNGDNASAGGCCRQASLLLMERNKKCKALK